MKSKLFILGMVGMMFSLYACSENSTSTEEEPTDPFVGTWVLAPSAGSLAVGPAPGDYSWWSISADDVSTRNCLFDDEYVFNEDGTFTNNLGSATWLEAWQDGVTNEGCGTPIAPHNGETVGSWSNDDNTVTVVGNGVYMGLAKVHNTGENGSPANDTITYNYLFSNNNNTLELTISGWLADPANATWYFRFVKQ